MRVFYALILPELIHEHCLYLINKLKTQHEFKHIRWTLPQHLHITLRFHGDIELTQLRTMNTLLHEQLANCDAVELATRRLLLFPTRKPHILAMAIHLNESLARVVRVINEASSAVGIALEKRPFLAHVTLGRFHDPILHEEFLLESVKTVEAKANQIVLYQSEPTDSGSVYTILENFELK
jgi:RNA 2',3'-cyclic 3'-phosphodiesterase